MGKNRLGHIAKVNNLNKREYMIWQNDSGILELLQQERGTVVYDSVEVLFTNPYVNRALRGASTALYTVYSIVMTDRGLNCRQVICLRSGYSQSHLSPLLPLPTLTLVPAMPPG